MWDDGPVTVTFQCEDCLSSITVHIGEGIAKSKDGKALIGHAIRQHSDWENQRLDRALGDLTGRPRFGRLGATT